MASPKFMYKFLSEPDDNLRCPICLEVAKEPKQEEECGKLFCTECIEKNGSKPCPNCRVDNPQYFKDRKSSREIQDLGVRCDNVERGCFWEGTVGTLGDHVTMCGCILVPCPNECQAKGEDMQLMRKDLYDHLETKCPNRDFECEYCGEEGTYAYITEEHDNVCEMKIVPCPNAECTLTMERGVTEEHIKNLCDCTIVACKHKSIGCSVKKIRKYIKQHEEEDDKAHLHLALEKIDELDSTVSKLDSIVSKIDIPTGWVSITIKMSDFGQKKEDEERFNSKPFYTGPGGYKMHITVYSNGSGDGRDTHVSVYAYILQGPYDDALNWPFRGTITFEVLNQLCDANHLKKDLLITAMHNMQVGKNLGYPKYLRHSALSYNSVRNTQYLMNDILYFRVTVKVDSHKKWLNCTLD